MSATVTRAASAASPSAATRAKTSLPRRFPTFKDLTATVRRAPGPAHAPKAGPRPAEKSPFVLAGPAPYNPLAAIDARQQPLSAWAESESAPEWDLQSDSESESELAPPPVLFRPALKVKTSFDAPSPPANGTTALKYTPITLDATSATPITIYLALSSPVASPGRARSTARKTRRSTQLLGPGLFQAPYERSDALPETPRDHSLLDSPASVPTSQPPRTPASRSADICTARAPPLSVPAPSTRPRPRLCTMQQVLMATAEIARMKERGDAHLLA